MASRTIATPLAAGDVDELALALHHDSVYQYIGGLPTQADIALGLRRALAGPPAGRAEHWLNYGVRLASTGQLIGRLEATVHHGLAEVAFLYSPKFWGQGHATEGLRWLHEELSGFGEIAALWATTHPDNERSSALLLRAGYEQAALEGLPLLYSYETGDRVFVHAMK